MGVDVDNHQHCYGGGGVKLYGYFLVDIDIKPGVPIILARIVWKAHHI